MPHPISNHAGHSPRLRITFLFGVAGTCAALGVAACIAWDLGGETSNQSIYQSLTILLAIALLLTSFLAAALGSVILLVRVVRRTRARISRGFEVLPAPPTPPPH